MGNTIILPREAQAASSRHYQPRPPNLPRSKAENNSPSIGSARLTLGISNTQGPPRQRRMPIAVAPDLHPSREASGDPAVSAHRLDPHRVTGADPQRPDIGCKTKIMRTAAGNECGSVSIAMRQAGARGANRSMIDRHPERRCSRLFWVCVRTRSRRPALHPAQGRPTAP